jgi:DNA-binding NarL/FixJ family response regulator
VLIAHRDQHLVKLARERCPRELRLVVSASVTDAQRRVAQVPRLWGVIVGVQLRDGDGIALSLQLRARAPELPIVVMTRRLCRTLANRLFVTGLGYVVTPAQKPCLDVFFERARATAAGITPPNPSPADELLILPTAELDRMITTTAASPILDGIKLSRRQLEVLALAVLGYDEKESAAQLGISRYTVTMHRRALGEKTGVPVLRELARRVRCGESLPVRRFEPGPTKRRTARPPMSLSSASAIERAV